MFYHIGWDLGYCLWIVLLSISTALHYTGKFFLVLITQIGSSLTKHVLIVAKEVMTACKTFDYLHINKAKYVTLSVASTATSPQEHSGSSHCEDECHAETGIENIWIPYMDGWMDGYIWWGRKV